MKTITCLLLLIVGGVSAQTIPNNSFENWSFRNGWLEPDGYVSSNYIASVGGLETCVASSNPHTGSFALQILNRLDTVLNDTLQAWAISGLDYEQPGFAYNLRPQALTFYYQYNGRDKDTAACVVRLTKWNQIKNKQDTVALGIMVYYDSIGVYTLSVIPFTYFLPIRPDTCTIIFTGSISKLPKPENYLLIDDISFIGSVGVDEYSQSRLSIYPNPVSDKSLIHSELDFPIKVSIVNAMGKQVYFGKSTEVNFRELSAGVYWLMDMERNGTTPIRFLKL